MEKIEAYIISSKTKAIITETKSHYRSKILEENGEHYSLEKPEKIIDRSCIEHYSSMEGRRTYAQKMLNTKSKVPLAIIPRKGVYLVPTTSSRNENCVWLSYYQIKSFYGNQSTVCINFYDNTSTEIKGSANVFDMQYKRASQVIARTHRSDIFKKD